MKNKKEILPKDFIFMIDEANIGFEKTLNKYKTLRTETGEIFTTNKKQTRAFIFDKKHRLKYTICCK